ncbi:hypothetical protein [Streptomyces pratensis]|uniref:hypothetical protein n=1 Tax=Streptomyces pratensis TaxID=1169025 RepID=UPI0036438B92
MHTTPRQCQKMRPSSEMTAGPSIPAVASARRQAEGSQPLMNCRDLNRRLEPNRNMSNRGATGPVLLETAYPALDRVPGLVVLAVEEGRTATATWSAAPAVADLIDRLRNRAPDATSAQVGAIHA